MAEILTNNAMFSSFMIVLIVFALGDIVGKITKGKLSGMMVVMLLFLVGFLTKLIPADIIDQGGLTALSKLAIAMVLFNMGTTLNVKQLIEEWRTVLMAALCMLASCLVMLLVSPIIGFDTVLVGMPVINGAAMATSLMASAAAEKGLATAAALCAVIYSVQKFVGAPIASAMGIRYGKKLLKAYRENPAQFKKQETGNGASAKIFFADKHKEWSSANVMMALLAPVLAHMAENIWGLYRSQFVSWMTQKAPAGAWMFIFLEAVICAGTFWYLFLKDKQGKTQK